MSGAADPAVAAAGFAAVLASAPPATDRVTSVGPDFAAVESRYTGTGGRRLPRAAGREGRDRRGRGHRAQHRVGAAPARRAGHRLRRRPSARGGTRRGRDAGADRGSQLRRRGAPGPDDRVHAALARVRRRAERRDRDAPRVPDRRHPPRRAHRGRPRRGAAARRLLPAGRHADRAARRPPTAGPRAAAEPAGPRRRQGRGRSSGGPAAAPRRAAEPAGPARAAGRHRSVQPAGRCDHRRQRDRGRRGNRAAGATR